MPYINLNSNIACSCAILVLIQFLVKIDLPHEQQNALYRRVVLEIQVLWTSIH